MAPTSEMRLAAFRGREVEARTLIESARKESLALGQGIDVQVADWMLALLFNGLGRYSEALTAAQQASNDSPEGLILSAWATPELLEAATKCDSPELARAALSRMVAATGIAKTDSARGMEARCRALMSEGATAERLYRESIERLGRSRLRPELARVICCTANGCAAKGVTRTHANSCVRRTTISRRLAWRPSQSELATNSLRRENRCASGRPTNGMT